jgi:hypothetical protein
MPTKPSAQGKQRRQTRRQQVAAALLGLAVGLGTNLLSTDVGYRGAAGVAALAAVIYVAEWLRRLHPRAPIVRIATWAFLAAAAVGAIVAVGAPDRGSAGYATLGTALLATTAVLIPGKSEDALQLLLGVAGIGVGVAAIGLGVALLRSSTPLRGVALIGGGAAIIGLGVAALRSSDPLRGVALIGAGAAIIGLGAAVLRSSDRLYGVALIGAGAAIIGLGLAALRSSDPLRGVALIGLGAAGIGLGVTVLWEKGALSRVPAYLRSLTTEPRRAEPAVDPGGLSDPGRSAGSSPQSQVSDPPET